MKTNVINRIQSEELGTEKLQNIRTICLDIHNSKYCEERTIVNSECKCVGVQAFIPHDKYDMLDCMIEVLKYYDGTFKIFAERNIPSPISFELKVNSLEEVEDVLEGVSPKNFLKWFKVNEILNL